MGLLSTIAPVLGTSVAGVVTTLAAAEFSACAPSWARRIVRRAARSLPEEERIASEAEWLSHVDDVPGNLSKLLHACGLWHGVLIGRVEAILIRKYLQTFVRLLINPIFALSLHFMMSIFMGFFFASKKIHGSLEPYDVVFTVIAMLSLFTSGFYWIRRFFEKRRDKTAILLRIQQRSDK